ncbi:MAG: 5-oxopent-3-ene-1,2,5-tricarboxylate decarboxylase, partial [Parvibaculum sp.]|nr:5-oxopent-3-ene-1,2,5-tricarboxylate decarboxylase [Parvibaculum sp.]
MRFVTFDDAGTAKLGGLVDGEIADLSAVSGLSGGLLGMVEAGEPAFAAAQNGLRAAARRPLEGTKLLPVIPRPGKIICLGLNYAE